MHHRPVCVVCPVGGFLFLLYYFALLLVHTAADWVSGEGRGGVRGRGCGVSWSWGGWFGRRDSLYSLSVVGMPLPEKSHKRQKAECAQEEAQREVLASLSLKSRPRLFAGVTNRQACYILFRFDFFFASQANMSDHTWQLPPTLWGRPWRGGSDGQSDTGIVGGGLRRSGEG